MSFLVNRAKGYTSFITRKIDLSKSLVINQSSKLSLVENDLSLTVIRIKMDKFINRGLLNDCFYFIGNDDLVIRDSLLPSLFPTVTFYKSPISHNESMLFFETQSTDQTMVQKTKQMFVDQKMKMFIQISSTGESRHKLKSFFVNFLESKTPGRLYQDEIKSFVQNMPELLYHLKIDQITDLVKNLFTFYGFGWDSEYDNSIVDDSLALTSYWSPNHDELKYVYEEIAGLLEKMLVNDLIWTSFDELYEQIKDNLSDYQIPYCMLIVYISDLIDQSNYSAFFTNQLT